MIKIKNLNKYFNKNKSNEIHVINNTSIEFPKVGLVTLLGESGSGKTTLLNVIGGLDDFDKGEIDIDGSVINKYSPKNIDKIRNEKIAYIFQNFLLLHQKTIYENLEIVLNMYDLDSDAKKERIEYVLKSIGMLKYKNKKVSELSGGQQQRVAIARALIKAPSVILADEPTGNLDEKNTIEIMNILKKVSKNTLVILVSHEKRVAYSYSDYIIEIKDGKIVETKELDNNDVYQFEDDQNIYLKELNNIDIKEDNVNISFYSSSNKIVNLKIVYANNNVYIQSDENIQVINESSEVNFIDDYKKVLDTVEEINNNDYELERLKFARTPGLGLKEQFSLALANISRMRKKIAFLSLTLFIVILLVLTCVQSIISGSFVDRQKLGKTDSRVYNILLDKGDSAVDDRAGKYGFELFFKDFIKENEDIEPLINFDTNMTYIIDTFSQLSEKEYVFSQFSVVPLSVISEDDLKYGRMPKNSMEIVVDEWVLENNIKDTTLENFVNVSSLLNQKVTFKGMYYPFTIVGISKTNENSVYVDKWPIIDIYMSTLKLTNITFISKSELENHLGYDLNIELGPRECLWNHVKNTPSSLSYFRFNDDYNMDFRIVDKIDFNGLNYTAVVNDDVYNDILLSVLKREYQTFNVLCENDEERKEVDKFVSLNKEKYASGELKATIDFGYNGPEPFFDDIILNLSTKSLYDNSLASYYKEASELVRSRLLITIVILSISFLVILFSMKSFVANNIYDIGVYRAIGIKKSSIVSIYAIEMLYISLKTTFVGGFLYYVISNFVSSIPMIGIDFAISFMTFIYVTFGLIIINVLIGIIPVIRYLRLSPSKILTKCDF